MFLASRRKNSKSPSNSTLADCDDDDHNIIDDADVEVDVDAVVEVDVDKVPAQKPHFLDYDAVPPPDFEESFDRALCFSIGTHAPVEKTNSGEHMKLDKKYERDGEISDYELAASGYTKKEFTQDDNTLHLGIGASRKDEKHTAVAFVKPKHFLDENPIPPDYMLGEHEIRENRSLDRNFERQNEQRTESPSSLNERKSSLDRGSTGSRSSRGRMKEPSYTLSRFLDSDAQLVPTSPCSLPQYFVPSGVAWTDSFDSRYGSLQLPPPAGIGNTDVVDPLGPKVECVYSLLSMLGSNDPLEMAKKFHELSRTPETCATLRRSGCIPLLVQMMHSEGEENVRKWAGMALHNVVHSHPDEKAGRREAKVLRLLDQIMDYCNFLKTLLQSGGEAIADDSERHPLAAMSSLMKVSFDEEHRHAMCELGALQAIPSLVHLDHAAHGPKPEDQCCNSLRRYALMALTNLTFGDENNKALLCSQKLFMEALVAQLDSAPDDLLQVTASVLRNLSWRADNNMKAVLNEIGTVTTLARAAMKNKSENTLKAILSALWNLSAHCSTNKAEFCAVDGALAFLVNMLTYEGPSKTLKIIENAGGILRNVSSHIAVREDYRQILREHNCLAILLQQLKSESLTVVSNSCGTLWNLSARCPQDQKFLWDNGAVPMLRSLIHSKHAMISEGSSCALKNLLNFRPSLQNQSQLDPIARSMGLKKLPTLNARKQKALEQELGEKEHAETCDNLDVGVIKERPNFTQRRYPLAASAGLAAGVVAPQSTRLTRSAMLPKSESRDSVFSAKSDSAYENLMRSHSASDANRKTKKLHFPTCTAFPLETDIEPTEEQPIDYSVKYNENLTKAMDSSIEIIDADSNQANVVPDTSFGAYQETDLDQPTDFSLRYAEHQNESDMDISPPEAAEAAVPATLKNSQAGDGKGSEILLILEDSVKCYQTEDTPYVISNAASVTDLRQNKTDNSALEATKPAAAPATAKKYHKATQPAGLAYGSGTYTPEKPINYCEEGTPGYFSRYESLSSLDESPANATESIKKPSTSSEVKQQKAKQTNEQAAEVLQLPKPVLVEPQTSANTANNSALETPLMFSRHSSMDSLVEEDVGPLDDKSSVVSDFSRLASGVISPSELPDSPTQSMPQSPRRNSVSGRANNFSASASPVAPRSCGAVPTRQGDAGELKRSVFEDNMNTFHVENTPAQFSSATSLSNLSIMDEENLVQEKQPPSVKSDSNKGTAHTNAISEGEEEEAGANNDDMLLANCINIGMNRTQAHGPKDKVPGGPHGNRLPSSDEPRQYFTEDTPALLSKVGSNTDLSAISLCSSNNVEQKQISGDVSSNASESGATGGHAYDLLQQCIRDGMKKPQPSGRKLVQDPIAMMRRGGNILPPYLPVSDEMNKYLIEDSPCNFSVTSGLSNLTVGSSLVGPAVQLKGSSNDHRNASPVAANNNQMAESAGGRRHKQMREDVSREPQWQDDSLSSLSIDSEDDTNLLSQAIAAGCNRPKSNLGFSSTATPGNKRSLSASQPIPINSANSTSSLNSAAASRHYQKQHQAKPHNNNGNESYSSVDSSDSNDNQSKSLFELCILTGMHKTRESSDRRKQHFLGHRGKGGEATSTQSNPNLKQFDSLPVQLPHHRTPHTSSNRHIRDRERKDEKLLQECINTGISKKIGAATTASHAAANSREPLFAISAVPKNVQATSAAASELCRPMEATTYPTVSTTAAPDVEKSNNNDTITSTIRRNRDYRSHSSNTNREDITDALRGQQRMPPEGESAPSHASAPGTAMNETTMNGIGSNHDMVDSESNNSLSLDTPTNSDDSNESFIMETTVSLEGRQRPPFVTADKHKDPDLMLKSVERLTLEFVTSAEQLRTNSYRNIGKEESCSGNGSNSHNTWNEDTCPNDVSFPSVSVTAPVVSSFKDDDDDDDDEEQATEADHKELHDFAEITPTNEDQPQPGMGLLDEDFELYNNATQPNSLETETDTLVNEHSAASLSASTSGSGINFKLGGAVQSAAAVAGRNLLFSSASANITNSTIMAIEARALAANLEAHADDDSTNLTFSINSLDLDNIRPPSCMESLNISGYYQESSPGTQQPSSLQRSYLPQSPQISNAKSPKFPRKLLPAGLMARRALGQLPGHLTGSAESVNSSCNMLDNIKPPSLMDELLDSMISVASIQSEVADCESMATTISISNYETAAGGNDFDDNTVTLQSCCDIMPHDDEVTLASDNDFSSAESTPKKSAGSPNTGNKNLTPKQKRKSAKDRYKTYTIAGGTVLNEQQCLMLDRAQADETLQIEITENCEEPNPTSPGGGSISAHRRRTSQDRYKTQTIVYATQSTTDEQTNCSLTSTDDCPSEELSSIRAMTKQFKFITAPLKTSSAEREVMPALLPDVDCNSIDYDQNSETESCHGHNERLSDTAEDPNDNEIVTGKGGTFTRSKPRILKPGDAPLVATSEQQDHADEAKVVRGRKKPTYVSPYSMQFQRNNTSATTRVATTNKLTTKASTTAAVARNPNIGRATAPTTSKMAQKKKINDVANVAPAATIERQATFVKDEPTVANAQVPVVDTAVSKSPQSSPTQRASKLPTKRQNATPKTAPVARKSVTPTVATSLKSYAARRAHLETTPQRSNSNANIRVTSAAARIAVLSSRVSATTPPSRSNSTLTAQTTTNKINQAQSRIASIWKRVDDAKSKQTPASKANKSTSNLTTRTPAAKSSVPHISPPKQKLMRSATYETIPSGSAAPPKTNPKRSLVAARK